VIGRGVESEVRWLRPYATEPSGQKMSRSENLTKGRRKGRKQDDKLGPQGVKTRRGSRENSGKKSSRGTSDRKRISTPHVKHSYIATPQNMDGPKVCLKVKSWEQELRTDVH